jgi:hypothetical protein
MTPPALESDLAGIRFPNPVLLAAGTAAYGRELADVMPLEVLGGLVTKAVSLEPRPARRPRASRTSPAGCSTPWDSRIPAWRRCSPRTSHGSPRTCARRGCW